MHGTKARNLHAVKQLGLPVPEFYEIDAATLTKLDEPAVKKKVLSVFSKWREAHNCQAVAVRSSAKGEDTIEQSFAGQYDSVMNIKDKNRFLKALRTVADSKPSSAYSSKKGLEVHAIVQRYIEPDIAGVLFTVNPSNGLPEMIINAVKGHGSKVVEGGESKSVHIDRIADDLRFEENSSILTKEQVRLLQETGEKIERHFSCPQDIEWAFSDGKLHILQTRPITKIAHLQVWDNANLGESFPGIVMPLTFSIARRGYELAYKSQSYEAGLDWYQLESNHRTFNAMVGLFAGRMYYNLASWYRFIGLFPNNNRNQKYLDQQLQTIGNAAYLPPSKYPLSYKVRFYSRIARRTLLFERERKHFWKYLEKNYRKYENLPLGNDIFILLDRYKFIEQSIVPHMGRSADNDFFVMIYHGILKNKFAGWFGEDSTRVTDFLGSLHEVISAKQADLLNEIAAGIKSDPVAANLLKNSEYDKLDIYLLNSKISKSLLEYRQKFLHRFAEDQKIEALNPLLPLEGFYSLIKTYQQLNEKSVRKRRHNAQLAEIARNRKIMQNLGFSRKLLYKFLLNRLKHHLRIREHNRLLRGKAYAYLRELFQQTGPVLKSKGLIDKNNDIYYLDIEELIRLTNGAGYGDNLKNIISSRKKSYAKYKKIKAPGRFITTYITNSLPEDFISSQTSTKVSSKSLPGSISSPGNIEGKVIVLDKPVVPKEPFDILVVSHTDPGWTPLIALAKGLVVEHGGILSHAAIVTRELGIPSIIGVEDATRNLKDGMKVRINSARGTVDIL